MLECFLICYYWSQHPQITTRTLSEHIYANTCVVYFVKRCLDSDCARKIQIYRYMYIYLSEILGTVTKPETIQIYMYICNWECAMFTRATILSDKAVTHIPLVTNHSSVVDARFKMCILYNYVVK